MSEIEELRINMIARITQNFQVKQSMSSDNEFVAECKELTNYIDTLYNVIETAPNTSEELQFALDALDSDQPERLWYIACSIVKDLQICMKELNRLVTKQLVEVKRLQETHNANRWAKKGKVN